MNSLSIILISIIFILLFSFLFYFFYNNKKNTKQENKEEESLSILTEVLKNLKDDLKMEIRDTRKELDNKIYTGQKDIQKEMNENIKFQTDNSQKLIKEIFTHLSKVNESVIEVKEGNKQVLSMTDQLTNLEKVLTNQKQRGNWGESSLELILSNFLPKGVYEMQYKYKSGEIVDSIINIKDKILPIDSKFSFDNYRRCIDSQNEDDKIYFGEEFKKDIKNRIEETAKYIDEVNENTLSFAFMFIPSEAIYYDINAGDNGNLKKINTNKLLDFARSKKVILVSPTSILAYLHLVISGIKDGQIEKNIVEIKKKTEELGKHLEKYEDYIKKMGASLNTTVNHYNNSYKELKKIDKDIFQITEGVHEKKIEPVLAEKVDLEIL